jgi:hypothetical protein
MCCVCVCTVYTGAVCPHRRFSLFFSFYFFYFFLLFFCSAWRQGDVRGGRLPYTFPSYSSYSLPFGLCVKSSVHIKRKEEKNTIDFSLFLSEKINNKNLFIKWINKINFYHIKKPGSSQAVATGGFFFFWRKIDPPSFQLVILFDTPQKKRKHPVASFLFKCVSDIREK